MLCCATSGGQRQSFYIRLDIPAISNLTTCFCVSESNVGLTLRNFLEVGGGSGSAGGKLLDAERFTGQNSSPHPLIYAG